MYASVYIFCKPTSVYFLSLGLFMLVLNVWGELASHKRSSTLHPSSQGWASGVLLHSVCYVLWVDILKECLDC